jgi:predicted RNase H-like HicB family nuclease
VPAFGFVTEGRDAEGARHAAYAAIEGYIKGAERKGFPIPEPDLQLTHTIVMAPQPLFPPVFTTTSKKAGGRKKKVLVRRTKVAGGRKKQRR